jgi:carbon-monoxide dehydrogenase medium subunit
MDIALTSVAVHFQLAGNRLTRPRVAAGAVAPCPLRLRAVENLLEGRAVDAALLDEAARLAEGEIAPITDIRASASYRRRLTSTLVRRAITAACEESR